jgi:hypothetical protein
MCISIIQIGFIISLLGTWLFPKLSFIQIGLIINFVGAGLLAKLLIKSDLQIKQLATYRAYGTVFIPGGVQNDINSDLVKSLKTDRFYGKIGVLCFLVGFLLQFIGSL